MVVIQKNVCESQMIKLTKKWGIYVFYCPWFCLDEDQLFEV